MTLSQWEDYQIMENHLDLWTGIRQWALEEGLQAHHHLDILEEMEELRSRVVEMNQRSHI